MPVPRKDYTGRRHHSWTILERTSQYRALVRCDCGWQGERNLFAITRGISKHCQACAISYQHGWTGTPEHDAWCRARLTGRIARSWSFGAFKDELGPRPDDRRWLVPTDHSQPVGPGNARWGTRSDLPLKRTKVRTDYTPRLRASQLLVLRTLAGGPKQTKQIASACLLAERQCYGALRRLLCRKLVCVAAKRAGQGGECLWSITRSGVRQLETANHSSLRRAA